jgi:hypothetical protein
VNKGFFGHGKLGKVNEFKIQPTNSRGFKKKVSKKA